ncbi:hypothetical protein FACS1894211_07350 [Clostridia bacterium]|nr:hypothetical protein FACS1894211_07350 [Clostridia bacterium]
MYRYFLKPVMDVLSAFLGLLLLSPVFLILIAAIKLDSRGPVLFRQERVGRKKKFFTIYKFRTMRIDTPKDTPTHLLTDPNRYITRTGRFLRKTSLDELPQILNILFGKMSVIGPRPALWNQDDLVAERDKYGANGVRPGLSGWAQVNGRDELEIPAKAALDGEYVRRMGFFFDVKIFFKTIGKVFKSDGVVEGGVGKGQVEDSEQWIVNDALNPTDNCQLTTDRGNGEQRTGIGCHSERSEETPSTEDKADCELCIVNCTLEESPAEGQTTSVISTEASDSERSGEIPDRMTKEDAE